MFGNTVSTITTTAPPQTVAPSGFQNALTNINSVLTNVVKPAADIYQQVKPQGSGGSSSTVPTYSPNVTAPATPPPAPQSNTGKYLLIGGVVILAGAGIYFATRKKKGK